MIAWFSKCSGKISKLFMYRQGRSSCGGSFRAGCRAGAFVKGRGGGGGSRRWRWGGVSQMFYVGIIIVLREVIEPIFKTICFQ